MAAVVTLCLCEGGRAECEMDWASLLGPTWAVLSVVVLVGVVALGSNRAQSDVAGGLVVVVCADEACEFVESFEVEVSVEFAEFVRLISQEPTIGAGLGRSSGERQPTTDTPTVIHTTPTQKSEELGAWICRFNADCDQSGVRVSAASVLTWFDPR